MNKTALHDFITFAVADFTQSGVKKLNMKVSN